ncbi:replication-relaxation family protein [Streptomyces sp. NPDC047072]|uniref:replication-relaxation family protein n=1 Tax=Streptomyces sp. NPDC047072 TaxID=3154809 RepID=UPI0033E09710
MPTHQQPLSGGRLAQLAHDLTVPEQQLLRELGTVHLATTNHLSRLAFGWYGWPTARRLGHRHVQRLVRFGLIQRYVNRSRDRKVGPAGYVLALTADGAALNGSAARRQQRRTWEPSEAFLAHRLAITELYVQLVEEHRVGGPTVSRFEAEPDCWRFYLGGYGERSSVKPDAYLRLELDRRELSWFVEIDRGTEAPRHIAAKCAVYAAYELADVEQRQRGVFPGILFIVPTERRAQSIQAVIDRQPPDSRDLFRVATEPDALTALGTVW